MHEQTLAKHINNVMLRHYNSSHTMKLPFFTGFLSLELELNNGMINVLSSTSSIMGEERACDLIDLGYTTVESFTKSVLLAIKKLKQEGQSYEAKLFHDYNCH